MLRRAILVVTGTAAAVTSALVYNPPQLAQVATSSKAATPATSTAPSGKSTPAPKATQSTALTTPSNLPTGNFAGDKVSTRWGQFKLR
jgi:hypothetical protein